MSAPEHSLANCASAHTRPEEAVDGRAMRERILEIHRPGQILPMYGCPGCTSDGDPWPCATAVACGVPDTRTPLPERDPDWRICFKRGCERERWYRPRGGLLGHCEEHTCRALLVSGDQCRGGRAGNGPFCGFHVLRSSRQLFTATVEHVGALQ